MIRKQQRHHQLNIPRGPRQIDLVKSAHRFSRFNDGPMKRQYSLIVVDSFSKLPGAMNCKNTACTGAIRFLRQRIGRFGIPDKNVSDNGTQFIAKEFKDFCKAFSNVHITTALFHSWSDWQAKWFVDTFKRALKKVNGNKSIDDMQQFLRVYRGTPNPNINSGWSPRS